MLGDDGSPSVAVHAAGGPALTLRAKGGKLSLSVPGGGEIVSGADGVLTLEPTADGAMRVQSLSGSGVTTQSRIRPSGPPSATLAAVEEFEYTPYGVPSVHAKEAAGAASLRVWDEAKTPASSAGALTSNTREGKAYGNYLAVSDSPLGATTQTARKANSAAMSSIGLKYMYAGRPWSAPGEVSYNRARWYSPESGRFLSRDPIGYLGGAAQYMYVGGNPIMWRDPTGLEPEEGENTPTPTPVPIPSAGPTPIDVILLNPEDFLGTVREPAIPDPDLGELIEDNVTAPFNGGPAATTFGAGAAGEAVKAAITTVTSAEAPLIAGTSAVAAASLVNVVAMVVGPLAFDVGLAVGYDLGYGGQPETNTQVWKNPPQYQYIYPSPTPGSTPPASGPAPSPTPTPERLL